MGARGPGAARAGTSVEGAVEVAERGGLVGSEVFVVDLGPVLRSRCDCYVSTVTDAMGVEVLVSRVVLLS